MKRVCLFLLAVFALTMLAPAQQTASSSMPMATAPQPSGELNMAPANREMTIYQERQQVQSVTQQLDQAAERNDANLFASGLAPDYVASNADSREEHKQEIVDAHRNGDIKYDSVKVRDQSIDVIGKTAIERDVADVKGTYKGKRFDGTYSATRMWKILPDGNWQLAAEQVRREH